jgi:hypothetical protein
MPSKLTKEDTDFFVKAFWVIAPFTVAWDLITHYRTTVTIPVPVPFLGNLSYSKAVIISLPVLSICLWLLSAMVSLYARRCMRRGDRITDRLLPIFGSVSQPLQLLAALLFVIILILPVITTTHFLIRMQAPDMGIVVLHDETRHHLTGSEILDFREARDWRWRDPQDPAERPTAFPGWQPWSYFLMVLCNYFAVIFVFLAVTLRSASQQGVITPAEP